MSGTSALRRRAPLVGLALATALCHAPAFAATYVVPAEADTWIEENHPADPHGTDNKLKVKSTPGDSIETLYRFDLGSIPSGARVIGASLDLEVNNEDADGVPLTIHRVVSPWTEATATWTTAHSSIDHARDWGSIDVSATGPTSAGITDLVRDWTSGALPNEGLALSAGSLNEESKVYSREEGDPARHPLLTVVTESYPGPDLLVRQSVDKAFPAEGDSVTFTVDLLNPGTSGMLLVSVQEVLPPGLTYRANSRTTGLFDPLFGTWSILSIAAGDSAQLRVIATVDAGTAGRTLQATASLTGSSPADAFPANDVSSAAVAVLLPTSANLAMTKVVDDSLHAEGETALFTVTVRNGGPAGATDVYVSDLLPAGLVYAYDVPSRGTYDPGTGEWKVGSIAAGDSATLDLAGKVDAGYDGQRLVNVAAITATGAPDPDPTNDVASAYVLVPAADLALTKTGTPAFAQVGETVTFTVTVLNRGPTTVDAIAVTDPVPAGLVLDGTAPSQGNYAVGLGRWNVGVLAVGDSATLVMDTHVAAGSQGRTIWNVARISASGAVDTDGSNDADSASVVVASADLAVGKAVDDPAPDEGDTVRFTVTVGNAGPDAATGVQVTDVLPAGLTAMGSTADRGTWDSGTGVWDVGGLAPGDTVSLAIDATVDAGTAGTTLVNVAARTGSFPLDPGPSNDADSVSVAVRGADVQIGKTASSLAPDEGESFLYTVAARNLGPDAATGVVVADSLPAGLSLLTDTPSQGTYDSGTGLWTIGDLGVGATATLALFVQVDAGQGGGSIVNQAARVASSPVDPAATNDSAAVTVDVPLADLQLAKAASDSTPSVGQTVTWTIRLVNAGPDLAENVVVADSLPAGVTFLSAGPDAGSFDPGTGAWSVGDVAPGDTLRLTLSTVVDPGSGGQHLVNTAAVVGTDTADSAPANDSAMAAIDVNTIVVLELADLGVALGVDDSTPREGDPVRWTLTLTNAGPDPAGGVAVTDDLPPGVTFVAATPSQGTYDSGTGTWAVGGLASGASATLDLDVTVNAGTNGDTITNYAVVTASSQSDPLLTNNGDSSAIDIEQADLVVLHDADRTDPDEGDPVTLAVRLVNDGPDPVAAAVVEASLPAGLAFVGATPERGSYDSGSGLWTVGAVAAGDTASLALDTMANAGTGGLTLVASAAVVGSDQGDPDASNDADSTAITVRTADLRVTKTGNPTVVDVGDPVSFTITVANAGPDSARAVRVDDLLPAGLSFDSAMPSRGSYDDGTGRWTVGDLAAADSATLVLAATSQLAVAGSTVVNVAAIGATGTHDGVPANDADSASVAVTLPPGVVIGATQPTGAVLPRAPAAHLMSISFANSDVDPHTIRTVRLARTTAGPGTPAQLDAELGTLALWRDDGDGVFERSQDTRISLAPVVAGVAEFSGLSVSLPGGALAVLHVSAALGAESRDGDVLDVALSDATAVELDGSPLLLNGWPVAPPGGPVVDGMAAAQVAATSIPSRPVWIGATDEPMLDVVVPRNGYEDDVLQEVRLVNRGTATAADLDAVRIWVDGGGGTFDAGTGDDVLLGSASWSGTAWELTGLTVPLAAGGRRLFVSVDIAPLAVVGHTIRLGLVAPGQTGLVVASANDGPRDAVVDNAGTATIQPAPGTIVVSADPQLAGAVVPDAKPTSLLHLHLENVSAVAETLRTLTITNGAIGPGTPEELDASWQPLQLVRRDLSAGGEGADAQILAPVSFENGVARLSGLGLVITPGDTVEIDLETGASLTARDGDTLDLRIEASTDLVFSRDVLVQGTWPLDPPGSYPVDGMSVAQIEVRDPGPTNLLTGTTRNPSLSLVLPPNGYEADVLRRLDVVNLGTARAGLDLSRLEAWVDDGDGTFEPLGDALLGEMLYTGARWQLTGLAQPLPLPGGTHLFVTVDVADLAEVGRTVRLAVPGPPDPGVAVDSGNDGPVDDDVESSLQTISTVDRVTLTTAPLPPGGVFPGDEDVPALRIAWDNTYGDVRTLQTLTVTNATTGPPTPGDRDRAIEGLALRADDGDGILESEAQDPVLATASFSNGTATFQSIDHDLPAGASGDLFVTMDVDLRDAADGDALAIVVEGPNDVTFTVPSAITADWPLDAESPRIVDGLVAAQVTNLGTPPATLGPDEGPIPALDLVLPGNGWAADTLNGLTVVNLGDATATDLAELRLWRDGGDGMFDAGLGDDDDLGAMPPVAGSWSLPLLQEPIPSAGGRVFVSVRSSATPADSATVRLGIPVDGIVMRSANDGPLDAPVESANEIVLSTAALLTSIAVTPPTSTIDQTVTATMTVRNEGDSTIVAVEPSPLMPTGLGSLELLGGPVPVSRDLAPGGAGDFTWTYRAASSGAVRLAGSAHGTEQGTGQPRQSLSAQSNEHRIFVEASEAYLWSVESMPFSISRGQTDVVPLSLTFANPGGDGGSAIEVTALRLRVTDESGAGVVPADLLSRVVLKEGSQVFVDDSVLETTGDEIALDFAGSPLTIESSASAEGQATIGLALSIADSTAVPSFRISIEQADWVTVRDATSGAPVTVSLQEDPWPISSGLARVVAEATRLDVTGVAPSAKSAARGQADVTLLPLDLQNTDASGLASDVRVSRFDVRLVDGAGAAIPDAASRLASIQVRGPLSEILLSRPVGAADDSTLTLVLSSLISCPVNTPVRIEVRGTVASDATLGAFTLQLADTAAFDARDANTGADVEVVPATLPIGGDPVTVEAPAGSLALGAQAALPPALAVGERDVKTMTLALRHPGGSGTGPIRVDAITWRLRDDRDAPLVPGLFVDRIQVRRGTDVLGQVTDVPGSGDLLVVPITGLTIAAAAVESLAVVVDFEATAPAGFFSMLLPDGGVTAVDANLDTAVPVVPESGSFPFSSGLTQLSAPARRLDVSLEDAMPAVLVADGREIPVGTLTVVNPAQPPAGSVRVTSLAVRASDRDGNPLAVGGAIASFAALRDGALFAESGPIAADSQTASLALPDTLDLGPGAPVALVIRATLRDEPGPESLRLGWSAEDIGVVQPGSELLSIAVQTPDGAPFPLWTLAGNYSGASLAESWANFPNPFAAGREPTTFAFWMRDEGSVSLKLYSLRGEPVVTLLDAAPMGAGLHQETTWNGRNGDGEVVRNGVYVAEIAVRYADGGSDRLLRKVAVVR